MLWLELYTCWGIISSVTYYQPLTDLLKLLHSVLGAASMSLPVIVCEDFNTPNVCWLATSPRVNLLVTFFFSHALLEGKTTLTCYWPLWFHLWESCIGFLVVITMHSSPLLNMCCIIIIFKEVLSCVSWDVIDFDADDIELPWPHWKDLFFQL